jgi:acyl-CoA thioesterase FadM
MDEETLEEVEEALTLLLKQMKVPELRIERKDWSWFIRNLHIQNSDHELFSSTWQLLIKVMQQKREG